MREMVIDFQNRMKRQTIGVEIEMNNITRKRAAEVVAEFFGTEGSVRYIGTCYNTWGCDDNSGRVWKFERDASIRGDEDKKCELVTPILKYDDIETLQEIVRRLRKAGAVSNPSQGCGVHIHVGLKDLDGNVHSAKTLRNLANMMASHEDLLIDSMRTDRSRLYRWCRVTEPGFIEEINRKKTNDWEKFAEIWYRTNHGNNWSRSHYDDSRYHMLNLHACFTKGTIEFRCFQFENPSGGKKNGLHAGQLKSYIQLCLAMSQKAKDARSISPVAYRTSFGDFELNKAYQMRTWLKSLGLIGDEFKTMRDYFIGRLPGESSGYHVDEFGNRAA